MEIEKKFTIKKIPENLEQYEYADMIQGYLLRKPVVRVRKKNDEYILTYKSKLDDGSGPIVNIEEEFPLTDEGFYHLLKKCDGNIIVKRRYFIPLEEKYKGCYAESGKPLVCELDVFDDYLKGLVFAEVEFSSEEEAEAFVMPDWFDTDVTHDKHYSNGYLSETK
ncbi:MAG: adenylate cyclase [Lachnospiraceae bacterium]